jgi:hypothetical protein
MKKLSILVLAPFFVLPLFAQKQLEGMHADKIGKYVVYRLGIDDKFTKLHRIWKADNESSGLNSIYSRAEDLQDGNENSLVINGEITDILNYNNLKFELSIFRNDNDVYGNVYDVFTKKIYEKTFTHDEIKTTNPKRFKIVTQGQSTEDNFNKTGKAFLAGYIYPRVIVKDILDNSIVADSEIYCKNQPLCNKINFSKTGLVSYYMQGGDPVGIMPNTTVTIIKLKPTGLNTLAKEYVTLGIIEGTKSALVASNYLVKMGWEEQEIIDFVGNDNILGVETITTKSEVEEFEPNQTEPLCAIAIFKYNGVLNDGGVTHLWTRYGEIIESVIITDITDYCWQEGTGVKEAEAKEEIVKQLNNAFEIKADEITYMLYDMGGKKIGSGKGKKGETISIGDAYAQGLYILRAITKDKKAVSKKIPVVK